MVSFVFRQRRRKNDKLEVSRLYRGRFRLQGDAAIIEVPLNTTDKKVAEKMLAEIVAERERERAGIIAPKLQRDSATRPLAEHLYDYAADLTALGRGFTHVRDTTKRAAKLAEECGWKVLGDISANGFVAWRSQQTRYSAKTLNEYLNSSRAVLNWMVKQGRIPDNPLKHIAHADVRGKQQRRRAFTDDELNRLLAVAPPSIRLLYLAAAFTGLRIGELRQVVWGDLNLDSTRPHIRVRASTTKNRKEAVLPIHPQLLDELKALRPADREQNDLVFHQHAHVYRRIRIDMREARIKRLDSMGRKLDFHALRYTFATKLAASGVSQRLAQELLRHSDPRLTANIYTDVTQLPTFEAVNGLKWQNTVSQAAACTEKNENPARSQYTVIDTQNVAPDRQNQSLTGTDSSTPKSPANPHSERPRHVLSCFAQRRQNIGATGFEGLGGRTANPDAQRNSETQPSDYTVIDPHFFGTLEIVVAKLVRDWDSLPEAIQQAIIALVNSQDSGANSSS